MVTLVADEEASGKVAAIFAEIRTNFGMVPNFFRAQALDPDWLEVNWQRWKVTMGRQGALDRKTKELLAVAVSLVNSCQYCTLAHEGMAQMMGATPQELLETKAVVELFVSFNSIADSLRIPCDVMPGD